MTSVLGAAGAEDVEPPNSDAERDRTTIEALEACRRLAAEFPDNDPHQIEVLMRNGLEHTIDASVGTFRVLLAERSTRARLRALAAEQVQ
jgi:hypothetical protein